MRQPGNRGGCRGIRAVAVEHHRDAKLGEEFGLDRGQQRLASSQVAATDENGGILFVFGRARENGAFHQTADILRGDAAVGGDVIGAAVIAHHIVEHRGQGVGVELVQQLFYDVTRCCGLPATHRSTLSTN